MSRRPRNEWAVVGGGMLGMTLAHRLAERGQRVTLLEAADRLGGLASPWSLGDVVWDRHYHVTLLSDSHLRRLLDELGLEREMRWVQTYTGFFTDGKLHSMSDTAEFLRFPPLTLLEKLRLGATIFYASKIRNWRRLEQIQVSQWLSRWSGQGTYEKIWLPLLKAKLGDTYQDISAAFIWAHINRMYKARRSGLKQEMFGYVPGGYARILRRFGEMLQAEGVAVELNSPVEHIASLDDGRVTVDVAGGSCLEFDHVVLTTPSPLISAICPDLTEEEHQRFRAVDYLGIVCASLLLKKPISKYYVTNITDTWVPMTAVIEMTTIVDPSELRGHSLVYLPKYVHCRHEMFDRSDADVQDEFLSALERMYPHFSRDDVLAFRVSRVRDVMALPTLRYSEKLPPMKTSLRGVYAVNSAHILKGNLNVNETVEIAEEAISGVLQPALKNSGTAYEDDAYEQLVTTN